MPGIFSQEKAFPRVGKQAQIIAGQPWQAAHLKQLPHWSLY